jgi:hypothetical protein
LVGLVERIEDVAIAASHGGLDDSIGLGGRSRA